MKKIKLFKKKLRSKLRRKLLGPYAVSVVYDTQNGKISTPVYDETIGRRLGFNGEWNISEIREILSYVDKEDVVYILGAHVGTLLIPISQHCKSIIGYEANPDTFYHLNNNIFLNNIENSRIFNLAVGDIEKEISFYKSTLNSGGSKIKPLKDKYIYNYDSPENIKVNMVALSAHIEKENLPDPDHIIIDIEGSEYFALHGMQDVIAGMKSIYIEYVPHHLKNIANIAPDTFFDLIIDYFDSVQLVRQKIEFDIKVNKEDFLSHVNDMFKNEKSDDLLFLKENLPSRVI